MRITPNRLSAAIAVATVALTLPVSADDNATTPPDTTTTLDAVVVTAEAMDEPLKVEADPKAPRQPVPAHDGADYLKSIPGFAVTRKGGTDGDPLFRGMAASRLGILVDGENVLGGCNARMDAPTAYIYPEIYDALTVIKGPQTVIQGPGASAATVMFERNIERFKEPGYRLHASALAASASRHDVVADLQAGNRVGYLQASGSDASADDYRDGDGERVHSEYQRYSGNVALGLTPDDDTRAEISATQSDGEAAYADRSMDGTKFLRQSEKLHLQRKHLTRLIDELDVRVFRANVDHVMDDQELRSPGMMGYANLERNTSGGRLATTLLPSGDDQLIVGADTQSNDHSSRSAPASHVYADWHDDANFTQQGLFAEWEHALSDHDHLISGYRADRWEVTDERAAMIMTGMMPMSMAANPSSGETRKETLGSGFIRYEHDLGRSPATVYAGLGHAERFPDYWELIAKQGENSASAFTTDPEKTDQLDMGALYRSQTLDASISAFYSRIDDYILVDYTRMMVMNGFSRNVDATTYGSEVSVVYALTPQWKVDSSLIWTWGANDTDDTALAQLPPLEGRMGLTYTHNDWSAGALLRAVDDQDRFDAGRGTVVGKDLAPAGGFSVFSLNGSWKANHTTLLSAGIDNAFDRTYAEFVSRGGGAIPGYVQTERVNEPGRTLWTKVQIDL